MIEDKVRKMLEKSISDMGIILDSVEYVKENNNYFLRIVIDRDEPIDIDTCVEVTKVINPILDKEDIIDNPYTLEVWSKEKGE